ncbi:MAG TPA: urease accessory protein UreD [Catenuloplanes sp.]|jgi:urease accessory protein
MRATARLVAVADPGGGTRLAVLRGQSPLLPRRTAGRPGEAQVHLVGGAAGPLGGDDLTIEVRVEAGARLCVRSVAAAVALPGPDGARSVLRVRATVAPGASLRWLPEPLIAAAGCRHDAVSVVEVAAGGALVWRDELVCGRHGEAPGTVGLDTTIRYATTTLYRHQLAVGPSAHGWSGAAVLGAGRSTGSVVVIDPGWTGPGPPPAAPLGAAAAVMPLTGPAVLATAVGPDLRAVRAALDPFAGRTPQPLTRPAGPPPAPHLAGV